MRCIVHYNKQFLFVEKNSNNQSGLQRCYNKPFGDYINQLTLLYFTTMLQLASLQIAHSIEMGPVFLDFWSSGKQFWMVNQPIPGWSVK